MSQHHFYTICQDIRHREKDAITHIMIAWDRKLQQYSMVVYQNHYLNLPIFSISDIKEYNEKTLESYLNYLKNIGVLLPTQMIYELYHDAANYIGKKQVIHINKNGKYSRHEGARPILNLKIAYCFYRSDISNSINRKKMEKDNSQYYFFKLKMKNMLSVFLKVFRKYVLTSFILSKM